MVFARSKCCSAGGVVTVDSFVGFDDEHALARSSQDTVKACSLVATYSPPTIVRDSPMNDRTHKPTNTAIRIAMKDCDTTAAGR